MLKNVCLCMLKNSEWTGVSRDREDKEVIKNRIFYWLQQFRTRPCHSFALILGKLPCASAHWELQSFFVPLPFFQVHFSCRLYRAETFSQALFATLYRLIRNCGQCTLNVIGISKMKLCSLVCTIKMSNVKKRKEFLKNLFFFNKS